MHRSPPACSIPQGLAKHRGAEHASGGMRSCMLLQKQNVKATTVHAARCCPWAGSPRSSVTILYTGCNNRQAQEDDVNQKIPLQMLYGVMTRIPP
eukprot:1621503-Amphidinium_carterae.1